MRLIKPSASLDRQNGSCVFGSRGLPVRGVMPSGVLGRFRVPLTYLKQLNKVAHVSVPCAPASSASRPKQLLLKHRMSIRGQAATTAVRDTGATYPSAAGPGSQRARVNTLCIRCCCKLAAERFDHCSKTCVRRGQEGVGGQGGCFHF